MFSVLSDAFSFLTFPFVCGCCVAIIVMTYIKDRRIYFIGPIILFLFLWRLFYKDFMLSSRYYSILFFPAIFLNSYLFFFLRNINRSSIAPFFPYLFVALAFFSIVPYSLFVIFRPTPYTRHISDISSNLRKRNHSHEKVYYFINSKHAFRYNYAFYSRIPHPFFLNYNNIEHISISNKIPLCEQLAALLHGTDNYIGDCYIIEQINCLEEPDFASFLKNDSVELIHRQYSSHKKNKYTAILHFKPKHENIQEWQTSIPKYENNLLDNGDFESAMTGNDLDSFLLQIKNKKWDAFYTPTKLYPAKWHITLTDLKDMVPPDIFLDETNPIAGKRSLHIDSTHTSYRADFSSPWFNKCNNNFSLFVRNIAENDSYIYLQIKSWQSSTKASFTYKKMFFRLSPQKTYCISGQIDTANFPDDTKNITLFFDIRGNVLIDNCEAISY